MINKLKRHPTFIGYLFAITATALWSANFIIARGLNDTIPPFTIAFWRWLVATAIFLPFAFKDLKAEWHTVKQHRLYLSVIGLLGVSIFNTLIYFAGHTSTAINMSLIAISSPIFIIIFSRLFLRDLITSQKAIGILLVVSGVVLLITGGNVQKLLQLNFAIGDFWMLLAAVIFAVYSMILKQRPKGLSITTIQLSSFIMGLIFLSPFYIWEHSVTTQIVFNQQTILAVLYVGIGASLIGYLSWNKAIAKIGPAKAGIVYYTMPLFSAMLAHIFIGETVNTAHFISAILIVSGIITANFTRNTSRSMLSESQE